MMMMMMMCKRLAQVPMLCMHVHADVQHEVSHDANNSHFPRFQHISAHTKMAAAWANRGVGL